MQLEALAQQVVLIVKNALAPVVERVAAVEGRLSQVAATGESVAMLRERVAVAEAKSVDVSTVNDLLVAIEVKTAGLDEVKTKAQALETSAAQWTALMEQAVSPLRERLAVLESMVKSAPKPNFEIVDEVIADISKDVIGLRERMAAAEARAPIPGPPGPVGADGEPGKDGRDGRDGQDGSIERLELEQVDERTMRWKFPDGTYVKGGVWYAPVPVYRDVWEQKQYQRGDLVTWAGATWHCNEDTAGKPGEGRAWTLCVKKGRDGRDGKDAPGSALPVVSVGGRSQ